MTEGISRLLIAVKFSCIPKETKKMTAKKSLIGLIKEIISILYGRLARAIPAKNAPIAIDIPIYSNKPINNKHTAIADINNNSSVLAAYLNKKGRTNSLISHNEAKIAAKLIKEVERAEKEKFPKEDNTNKAIIAKRSCINNMPMITLP